MPDLYWKKRWAETFGCLSLARFAPWVACACAALRGVRSGQRAAWQPRRRWCDWGVAPGGAGWATEWRAQSMEKAV